MTLREQARYLRTEAWLRVRTDWPVWAVLAVAALVGYYIGKSLGPWLGAVAFIVALVAIPKTCLLLAYVVHTADRALARREARRLAAAAPSVVLSMSGRREERDRRRR